MSGSVQPEIPPRETPSTSPVSPTTKTAVPSRSKPGVRSGLTRSRSTSAAQIEPSGGEGDVEPEHPVPRDRDERAAEDRAEHEADRRDHRVRPHREAELLARERVGDDARPRSRTGTRRRSPAGCARGSASSRRTRSRRPATRARRRRSRRRRPACARTGRTAGPRSAPAPSRRSCRPGSPTRARGCWCRSARSRSGSAMISVPELIVASSIPRLVHDSAHHL